MAKQRRRIPFITLLIVCIVGPWVIRAWNANRFQEDEFRDTSGLTVTDIDWSACEAGYCTHAVLVNRRDRTASSVVLLGEVRDSEGTVIASNPLINVLNVAPSMTKEFEAVVPAATTQSDVTVSLKVIVVWWKR